MMLNKRALSRFGRSLSLQSCFPETKSAGASGCKSPEDDNLSINNDVFLVGMNPDDSNALQNASCVISMGPANGESSIDSVPPEISLPTSDAQHSHSNSLSARGSDSLDILNRSLRQFGIAYPMMTQITSFDTKTLATHDLTSSPLATVPYSGGISGDIRDTGLRRFVLLYLAALSGDWEAADAFLFSHPEAVRARITRNLETALHIAAGARHTRFVEELVNLMTPDDLLLQNKSGNTALCFAAASGIRRIAEVMVNKNKKLLSVRGGKGALPVYMAALLGHRDMVWYLYHVTEDDDLTDEDLINLLNAAITSNLFDVALKIIQQHPGLATARDGNGETALHVLARKPSAFPSGNQHKLWQRFLYSCLRLELPSNPFYPRRSRGRSAVSFFYVACVSRALLWKVLKVLVPGFKTIYDQKMMHIQAVRLVNILWHHALSLDDCRIGELIRTPSRLLFTAAELGILEFITVLVRSYPDLIWKVDDQSRSIFHVAVAYRQEKIFNLIYEIGGLKDLVAAYKDEKNTNMLHLAGKVAPSNRLKTDSGAALQLRRELLWFKEVEKVVQPLYTEMKDSEGRTPQMLFTEEHKGLVRDGEKWMKDTASSCMVVATLIATVMFAAAFTVPGGNNNDTGRPIFILKRSFMVFAISDAVALFSSATAILMFLSILTSRYAEEDFLDSLPNRLIIGLATLFISIATMMVAFCASLFIVLGKRFSCVAIPLAVLACVPVTSFALLQFPLLVDMVGHTYSSRTIFRPRNPLLY